MDEVNIARKSFSNTLCFDSAPGSGGSSGSSSGSASDSGSEASFDGDSKGQSSKVSCLVPFDSFAAASEGGNGDAQQDDYIKQFLSRTESNPILNSANLSQPVRRTAKSRKAKRAPSLSRSYIRGDTRLGDMANSLEIWNDYRDGPSVLEDYTVEDLRSFGQFDWYLLRKSTKNHRCIHFIFYLAYANFPAKSKEQAKFIEKISSEICSPLALQKLRDTVDLDELVDARFLVGSKPKWATFSDDQTVQSTNSAADGSVGGVSSSSSELASTGGKRESPTLSNLSQVLQAFLHTPGRPLEEREQQQPVTLDEHSRASSVQASIQKRPLAPHRIRRQAPNGAVYEFDRYCPHKRADLAQAPISGSGTIVCPKHKWAFDLSRGGLVCSKSGPYSLQAVYLGNCASKLNDW